MSTSGGFCSGLLIILVSGHVAARTITLTANDCDQMAVISAKVPRMSWATQLMSPGVYSIYNQIQLYPDMAVLMRFPLDKIPRGQRITKAEFSVPVDYHAGGKQELTLRRLLVEWGSGVCHQYRMVHPKKAAWAEPGARGITSDRANKVSAVFRIDKTGAAAVDVTQDIELWYTGAVANRGWIFTLDDPGGLLYLSNPYPVGASWKLQITFEPQ